MATLPVVAINLIVINYEKLSVELFTVARKYLPQTEFHAGNCGKLKLQDIVLNKSTYPPLRENYVNKHNL